MNSFIILKIIKVLYFQKHNELLYLSTRLSSYSVYRARQPLVGARFAFVSSGMGLGRDVSDSEPELCRRRFFRAEVVVRPHCHVRTPAREIFEILFLALKYGIQLLFKSDC